MTNTILYKNLGITIPSVLLPSKEINMNKWSVVACDQYTSEPEYWLEVENLVGDNPSTLHLTFPEVYLESGNEESRIRNINNNMKKYIADNILVEQKPCLILADRKTFHSKSRKGIILAVDLDKYDYSPGSQTLIRATEGTVIDRLPPRIKIRENAILELPHVMLLIDDPDKTVIEPLANKTDIFQKIYDFELMMNGGHIKGYKIDNQDIINDFANALSRLATLDNFKAKYNTGENKGVLLFAVGDGNHSLASAKGHWEKIKAGLTKEERDNHPARFALAEVVNIHDEGLNFEPIHRVVFNANPDNLLGNLKKFWGEDNCSVENFDSQESMFGEVSNMRDKTPNSHIIGFTSSEGFGAVIIKNPKHNLEVGSLQIFLDKFSKDNATVKIDYIHGEEVVTKLGSAKNNMGFYLPTMSKHDLFKTVIQDGVLPRKTFSMGEAEEKRFYLECRKISKD